MKDWKFNISLLVTLVLLVFGMGASWASLDSDVEHLQTDVVSLRQDMKDGFAMLAKGQADILLVLKEHRTKIEDNRNDITALKAQKKRR